MSRSHLSNMACTVARTVEIIGDSWTEMIVREMFLGSRRFDDLQRYTGASPHLLSLRLKRLEAENIISRRRYSERPPRFEYKLTEKGRDLWPIIMTLKSWGDRWLGSGEEPPIRLTHKNCGHTTQPYLVCSACEQPIDAVSTSTSISPAMIAERAAARTAN